MNGFDSVRAAARLVRSNCLIAGVPENDSHAIVLHALALKGLQASPLPPGDPLLENADAALDWVVNEVFYNKAFKGAELVALLAHEAGHAHLHEPAAPRSGVVLVRLGQEGDAVEVPSRHLGYGPKERIELQANLFARELLLPRAEARQLFVEGATLSSLENIRGLPKWMLRLQLTDGVLLPKEKVTPINKPIQRPILLDASQQAAVDSPEKTLLLEAGPGTGKTRTLIKRIEKLIKEGAPPESILVLTFSNKAAGEISERLASTMPLAATKVWAGTFHAFGLELARKFGTKFHTSGKVALVDQVDAITLLENRLHGLPIKHLKNIWLPGMFLDDVMKEIGRSKDEMVGPDKFQELAAAMLAAVDCSDEKELKFVEKVVEVGEIYGRYQELLSVEGLLDFGDLIMQTTLLLESDAEFSGYVHRRYRHIVVDEYQDVNRASVRMIKALRTDSTTLWVVGDARQSIYRFRGASDINMRTFRADHGGPESLRLRVNYRSTASIVDLCKEFATGMAASVGIKPLDIKADYEGLEERPQSRSFADTDASLRGLAASIQELNATGLSYSGQVVLARTHDHLAKIAQTLVAAHVPILYFGKFFARKEIRDLLCVLDLLSGNISALVQLAHHPRYAVPGPDIVEAIRMADETGFFGLKALEQVDTTKVSDPERLQRLLSNLGILKIEDSPANVLTDFLFDTNRFADGLLSSEGVPGETERLAVWQLIRVAREANYSGKVGTRLRRFVARVRLLQSMDHDKDFRQVPDEGSHLEAVSLMTSFAAKGLEFDAVHLPYMIEGTVPKPSNAKDRRMIPDDLIQGAVGSDWQLQLNTTEQECLYFVAASRAKRYLRHYFGPPGKASSFLTRLTGRLDHISNAPTADLSETIPAVTEWLPDITGHEVHGHLVKDFADCPRRYYFSHILGLSRVQSDNVYFKAKNCVDRVIRDVLPKAIVANLADLKTELAKEWEKRGPLGSPFEADYRALAEGQLEALVRESAGIAWETPEPISVNLGRGRVSVTPDQVAPIAGGMKLLRHVVTKRPSGEHQKSTLYSLYRRAAEAKFGIGKYLLEVLHLSHGAPEPMVQTDKVHKNRIDTMTAALTQIENREFPPKPGQQCDICPHNFYCPTGLKQPPTT